MNLEEALKIVDDLVFAKKGQHLSDLQKAILQASWENLTYQKLLKECKYSYEEGYIRNEASLLWNLLSDVLGVSVSKKTFRGKLEERFQSKEVTQSQVQEQSEQLVATPYQDWGAAPPVSYFYGRTQALNTLKEWILQEKRNLILLLGQGGIGKTTLSIKLTKEIQNHFEYVIWRSLEASPTVEKIIADAIKLLSNQQETILPETLEEKITRLIHYLESSRCLLILDNAESILQSSNHIGEYREGYQGYGDLLKRIAQSSHQSCLLITSREKPEGIDQIARLIQTIRTLDLDGLNVEDGQKIFTENNGNFFGSEDEWKLVIENYEGIPFALEVVAVEIQDSLGGNLSRFVKEYLGKAKFTQINNLL